jgi:hypothetical protein
MGELRLAIRRTRDLGERDCVVGSKETDLSTRFVDAL